ncbi:MAG: hypothetical protein EBT13_15370 [Rhodobacteraceae bacterium]|nr:hypothetical protein [Paracoccaceae bacterium]
MNDAIRDITHHNVVRLLAAIEAERDRTSLLQAQVSALQAHVTQLTSDVQDARNKANAAFAISRGNGATAR